MSSTWLIGVVSVLYTGQAAIWLLEGRHGMALVMVGYVIANAGLILAART